MKLPSKEAVKHFLFCLTLLLGMLYSAVTYALGVRAEIKWLLRRLG